VIFLADEGVDRQIVERLRHDGHGVAYVAEMSPGIMDEVVLKQSRDSASVLITADKDFGELVSPAARVDGSSPGSTVRAGTYPESVNGLRGNLRS
jgi:predicted nuclease of predicted toxin-antitoxin system